MGRLHCERLQSDGRGHAVAAFDIDPAAAQSLRSGPAPGVEIFRRFEDLVEHAAIDAAVICTPTGLHFEQASAFLARGIPVLCEKPLARTRDEIVRLIADADRGGVPLSVAYQRRSWGAYRTMRRLVQSGEFGPVRAVVSYNVEDWQQTIAGTWRDDPESNPAGFIGDAGSHKIDAVFFVTGLEPTEVFARCDRCGSRVEVTASVSALLSGNVPLTMDFVGQAQRFGEMLAVHCAEADLTLRDGELWLAQRGRTERIPVAEADSSPISAFLNLVLQGEENVAPPECALPVLDFTRAIVESSRTGLVVHT